MPLIRKVLEVGNSKAISIPKDWLKYYEKVYGKPIKEVGVEVNKVLKVFPLVEGEIEGLDANRKKEG